MKYDTNRDGTFSMCEVQAIVRNMESAKKAASGMGLLAAAVLVVAVVMCGMLTALMMGANEVISVSNKSKAGKRELLCKYIFNPSRLSQAFKESHVQGGIQVDLSGNPTQVVTL
jgi:hypothetical protein